MITRGKQNSPTYAGPPGAWDIDRNDRCALETGAVGTQEMARGAQMETNIVAVGKLLKLIATTTAPQTRPKNAGTSPPTPTPSRGGGGAAELTRARLLRDRCCCGGRNKEKTERK